MYFLKLLFPDFRKISKPRILFITQLLYFWTVVKKSISVRYCMTYFAHTQIQDGGRGKKCGKKGRICPWRYHLNPDHFKQIYSGISARGPWFHIYHDPV